MKSLKSLRMFAFCVLIAVSSGYAQKVTERYIPIGKSPGLSGKHTSIGPIGAVDVHRGTLTYADSSGTVTVKVDKKTKIWLDRSKQKLMNMEGSLSECKKGNIVEVKFRNNERREGAAAEWIKVEMTESGGK